MSTVTTTTATSTQLADPLQAGYPGFQIDSGNVLIGETTTQITFTVSDASKGYGDPDILDSLISPEEAMERWKDADK